MIHSRRGFTLAELLIATVVMGILGLALTRILINDSRFVSKVEAMMNARQAARAALNTMAVELQMASQGGLVNASRQEIQVQVPFVFGILCTRYPSDRYAVLVPTDSLMYAEASANGLAWRNDAGGYTNMSIGGVQTASPANQAACTDVGIRVDLPGSRFIRVPIANDTLTAGDVFYLYQEISYRFSTSVEVPGRLGLWRWRTGESMVELLAPFHQSSAFRFYINHGDTSEVAPPANLSDVTGLELALVGASEQTPPGSRWPPAFEVNTRLNFRNR